MPPLRLIVNADDLGMSSAVNAAIFRCLEAGSARSATLLANGPAIEEALRHARGFPAVSFGVHLNLSEFAPLTQGLGRFTGRRGTLGEESLSVGPGDADAVLAEWSAQVERVRGAGIAVSHFDSHQHLHHVPALFPVLRALQERYDVPRVRGMSGLRAPRTAGFLSLHGRLGALRQRLRATRFRDRLRRAGARTTDGFGSVAVFHAHARLGPFPYTTFEAMVHPGNRHSAIYSDETRLIEGDWLAELPFPVELISWREV